MLTLPSCTLTSDRQTRMTGVCYHRLRVLRSRKTHVKRSWSLPRILPLRPWSRGAQSETIAIGREPLILRILEGGTGGPDSINRSHFLGAVYGMEQIIGQSGSARSELRCESFHP